MKIKKLLSLVLSLAVVLAFLPTTVTANTTDTSAEPTETQQLATYQVRHYFRLHTEPVNALYKVETLEGYVGEKTAAVPLEFLGYKASSVTQRNIAADGSTIINITYSIIEYKSSDVNYDGEVDMLDAITLERFLAGWDGYDQSSVCIYGADVNVDAKLNANDVLTLLHLLVGNNPAVGKPDLEEDWGEWV